MTFPSSTGTVQDSLDTAWQTARSTAASIKIRTTSLSIQCTQANTTPVSGIAILDYATFLADAKLALNRVAAVSGIGTYAQSQIANNTINISTEFTNMVSALDGVVSWIITNFPKDGSSNLLYIQFTGDNTGRTQSTTFNATQLAGLKTQLDILAATIN